MTLTSHNVGMGVTGWSRARYYYYIAFGWGAMAPLAPLVPTPMCRLYRVEMDVKCACSLKGTGTASSYMSGHVQ